MKKPALISLLAQTPGGSVYGYERINALLKTPGLKRFRAAVAYARWDGIGLIAPNVEDLLKAGGEFQAMYGVGNGVTTADTLLYLSSALRIRAQAFGEAVDPNRLDRLARYEVHLDRKLERMLAMLFKLQELRRAANPT